MPPNRTPRYKRSASMKNCFMRRRMKPLHLYSFILDTELRKVVIYGLQCKIARRRIDFVFIKSIQKLKRSVIALQNVWKEYLRTQSPLGALNDRLQEMQLYRLRKGRLSCYEDLLVAIFGLHLLSDKEDPFNYGELDWSPCCYYLDISENATKNSWGRYIRSVISLDTHNRKDLFDTVKDDIKTHTDHNPVLYNNLLPRHLR